MSAYLGYQKKDGTIKCVFVEESDLESIGSSLLEYFNTIDKVKKLVSAGISCINEDEVVYTPDNDIEYDIFQYNNIEDFINDMTPTDYYYLYTTEWLVSKPNFYELKSLETVMEEEF